MVLLRFAPSPTGPLHLGGLRMALYNHLFAKKHGGRWILRIEDTDATRFVPGSVEGIRRALNWAGLEFDFGPGRHGSHAPYFQSERLDLYKDYSKRLLETGHAYRCFCSVDRLANVREKLARTGSNATYDRECLHLTEEEVARRVKAGEKSIVRLNGTNLPVRSPGVDLIFGHLKDAHASLATDPILIKSDLFPTYHLASVVDDHEMGITHVLRGEEWLPSLPLHLDLYAALKLSPPQFAHLPILLNADGSKMSKRNGDVQVDDYIKRGWEPVSVLNWLALAGWGARHDPFDDSPPSPEPRRAYSKKPPPTLDSRPTRSHKSPMNANAPDSTSLYTMPELIAQFDLTAITHRNSTLDPMKLEYLNKNHLLRERSAPGGLTTMADRIHDQVKEAFPDSPHTTLEMIEHAIKLLDGRLTNLKELPIHTFYLFEEPNLESEEAKEILNFIALEQEKVLSLVVRAMKGVPETWHKQPISTILLDTRKASGVPAKTFMKVLRYSLTGFKDGPAIADIMKVLGPERTLERLRKNMVKQV